MLLKVALNGARSKSENEYIPQSLAEIKGEVTQLNKIGYKVFHIHSYDPQGKESLQAEDVTNLVSMVKDIASDIQIGISSGEWIEPDLGKRLSYIKSWTVIPDFISVNMIEEGAIELSHLLLAKGIFVEAGLNDKKAAEIFAGSNLGQGCCRILIEPEDENVASALHTINEIEEVLDRNNVTIKRLLHGFNAVSWEMLREAKKRGYDSRMGMEDTIYLEKGKKVKSNLEIVDAARKIINAI